MAKLRHLLTAILTLTLFCTASAQEYKVLYVNADTDTAEWNKASLQRIFRSRAEATTYINSLPASLQTKGFITASVDTVRFDTTSATVTLFLGEQYRWAHIKVAPETESIMDLVHWPQSTLKGTIDFTTFHSWQQKILDYFEENGHPFGKIYLDNISVEGGNVYAQLKMDKGPEYKIDSIRIYGDAKVSNEFLQRYLDIPNGSIYSRKKLQTISKRISELSYVQETRPSDLTLLGTGSVLNLYLKAKRTSQVNALVGFLPNSDQLTGTKKLLLTVDANILLRNSFGAGETIGLVWQQLQQKSPRLNLLFEYPYLFHSPLGLNFSIDMYRQDSTYMNINMNLGTSYRIAEKQTAGVFLQRMQTIVNGMNTAYVLQYHQLPREADVSSLNLGVNYSFNNTDYRFNPGKGNEFFVTASAGTKNIKKNSQILDLKDPGDPSYDFSKLYDTVKLNAYQFRISANGAHYIPLGKQSTVKLGVNAGIYQSANYFRNELFRIGGYKLLRGFDEESQYVNQFAIGTAEYRYRIGMNSFFFTFLDGGWGNHLLEAQSHTYIGTGLGLSFETKAGIINMAWAVGKRDDLQMNLRQSKIHLGFASYF